MTDETDDERVRTLFAAKPILPDGDIFVAGVMEQVQRERVRMRERVQVLVTVLAALTVALVLPQLDVIGEALRLGLAETLPALPADPTWMTLLAALTLSAGGYLLAERA
jgi:hypothetical protein